jgi:hypothetical protein
MTYAAVAYMRTDNYGNVTMRFIQAQSRIKPVKSTATIPRMELMAMELGLMLIKKLMKHLRFYHMIPIFGRIVERATTG